LIAAIITITERRSYLRRGQRLVSTLSSHFSGGFTFAQYFFPEQRTLITTRAGVTRSGCATDVRLNCSDGHFYAHRFLLLASLFVCSLFLGVTDRIY